MIDAVKINKWDRIIVILMATAIFFENLMLVRIVGAPLKPTHAIFIAAIIIALNKKKYRISRVSFERGIMYILLPILPIYRVHDMREWFKSFIIWVIIILYLEIGLPVWNKIFQEYRIKCIKTFIYILLFVQILAIAQFILMNFAGIMFLSKLFGPFQFIESYISSRGGLYRAFSIFHEPSVLGWVNTTGFVCMLYVKDENIFSKKFRYIFVIMSLLTTIVSISASGMYMLVILILLYFTITSKRKYSFVALIGIGIMLPVLWNFTHILNPMKRLFSEYATVNSSGYERLNAPLQYAKLTLQNYPILGRGIGQEGNIDAVGVIKTAGAAVANNSLYQVIMNFGISAIFVIVYLFMPIVKNMKKDKLYFLIFVNLFGVFISTGAYLSLDFLAVLNISVFIKRIKEV